MASAIPDEEQYVTFYEQRETHDEVVEVACRRCDEGIAIGGPDQSTREGRVEAAAVVKRWCDAHRCEGG